MEEKTLYWLDGKLMGERTEDEVEEIITIAEAAAYAIHQRPGHILVYLAGDRRGEQRQPRPTGRGAVLTS